MPRSSVFSSVLLVVSGSVIAAGNHPALAREILATFDAYPFHPPRAEAPIRARVSHWVRPGDNVVFGWNSAEPKPAPECSVLESHYWVERPICRWLIMGNELATAVETALPNV